MIIEYKRAICDYNLTNHKCDANTFQSKKCDFRKEKLSLALRQVIAKRCGNEWKRDVQKNGTKLQNGCKRTQERFYKTVRNSKTSKRKIKRRESEADLQRKVDRKEKENSQELKEIIGMKLLE